MKAYRILIKGVVQSVGFRPAMHRAFRDFSGWVRNTPDGVEIYLEAPLTADKIRTIIEESSPPNSVVESLHIKGFNIKRRAFNGFHIRETERKSVAGALIPPDLGICDQCAKELLDKNNRRFLHPFINCTNCGPRFSIITAVPYDRKNTTMKRFAMCDACRREFEDPSDRRFHAQPICCNDCGPSYLLLRENEVIDKGENAVRQAAELLKKGHVGLIKGIGGYHLVCNAFSFKATEKVKRIKNRYEKPFAVIAKSIGVLERYCYVSKQEQDELIKQTKPIVLLRIKDEAVLGNVRFESPFLGVMLPYAPIHLLLFHFSGLEFLVATSANFTEKPLIYNDDEAFSFEGVDFVLANDRRIVRPLEDSIVQYVDKNRLIYRYARGFAPGVYLRRTKPNILALGADMKNNIALAFGDRVILSQYDGDLAEYENYLRFEEKVNDFMNFFNFKPDVVVCDRHPEYLSSNYARDHFKRVVEVQHHMAHFYSVLFEHRIKGEAIGVIMDGTGFGEDGNIWGGEFFIRDKSGIRRVGHIAYMPFAFADMAIREPYRLAIVWLKSLGIKEHPLFYEYAEIARVAQNVRGLQTSSAGRLFDVASVLLNITRVSKYEAQAAVNLMYRAVRSDSKGVFDYKLNGFDVDFGPVIEALACLYESPDKDSHARVFHNTFVDALVKNTLNISQETGIKTVVLSGGVFQNMLIFGGVLRALTRRGLNVYFNSDTPINDGGIALGQILLSGDQFGCGNPD